MEVREPQVRYLTGRKHKQSEVGPIPTDWEVRHLWTVAEIRSGIAKNANAAVPNPVSVHYLRVANVQDGFLDLSEMNRLTISRDDVKRYAVLPGDMLMNEGGDLDKLGRGALWRGEFTPCVHQNHVFVVRCGSDMQPSYLSAWTGSTPARRYFLLAGRQTTNLASINKTSLGRLPIALPISRAEQIAISEALSDADALIESLEQLLAKKPQIKQGAMQELLTGKRRLPGFKGPWVDKALGALADIRSGGTPSTSQPRFWDGDVPWCTPTDITALAGRKYLTATARRISAEGLASSSAEVIPAGSVVMTSRATIGECAINRVPMTTNQGFKNFVARDGTDAEFLYYLLQTQTQRFIALCAGSTFLEIGKTQLLPFEVRVPAQREEQTAIGTLLSDLDTELEAVEAQVTKARHLKQGMMQALLTGRIRLV